MHPRKRWKSLLVAAGKAVVERMRRLSISVSTWVVAVLTLGVASLPVFSRPGYESALLFGLLVPPITAVSTSGIALGASGSIEHRLWRCLARAGAHALVLLSWLSLRATSVGWCSPSSDLALLLLGPIAGIFMAAYWGCIVGCSLARLPLRRGRTAARIGCSLCGPAAGIVIGLLRFYGSPVVFAFDPFVGFFAGSPYDTGFDPTTRLLTYRAGTVGLWLCLWSLARTIDCVEAVGAHPRALSFRRPHERIDSAVCAVGLFGLGLFVAISSFGEPLGHRSSTAWIRRALSRATAYGRCEVVHGPTQKQANIQRVVQDCDAWLNRLERRLGTSKLEHVTAYVFDNPAQKERLMGAARTQIAKPWRREIYLNGAEYPDDVVGHELAHVVAGLTARGPFRVAGSLGGWLPDPGLIEGMAVALAPDEDGDLTALEWSAALDAIGKLPALEGLFTLGFLQHSGPLAYTVAGAFVEWIGQHHGKRAVRRWYAGERVEQATGVRWVELERRFRADLRALQLPATARDAASAKFERLGVYARRCPHAVDRTLAEADQRLMAGDAEGACSAYAQARALDASETRARFGLGACAERMSGSSEQTYQAGLMYREIAEDTALPTVVQLRARERLADLHLLRGQPDLARPIYEQIVEQVFEVDWRRSLKLKLFAQTKIEIQAVRALLLGNQGEPAWDVAVRELVRWSNAAPEQGTADYLLGRNYWQKGRGAVAVEHLERALERRIPIPEIRAEAVRQRAVVACAMGDSARAIALAESFSKDAVLPSPQRLGVLRVVERCAGRLVGDDWPETQAALVEPGASRVATPGSAESPMGINQTAGEVGAVKASPEELKAYDAESFDCPEGLLRIRGGEFHVGSSSGKENSDESPRFLTKIRGFCLERTEVTVDAYAECVKEGHCRPASGKSASCNANHTNRGNHPINCVDHSQAVAFCRAHGWRLPTEVEWEYAARGGKTEQKYPWGEGSPDGRACWKSPHSCPVASYAAGAFGLYDMSGNVWEWTSSDYGAYPWSQPLAGEFPLKIFRGGGWSRRFEKWMHLGLRNRTLPHDAGAHLGFRCARDVVTLACPFEREQEGECLFGVVDAECPKDQSWNGQRCAKPTESSCPEGYHSEPGRGCVRDLPMVIKGEALDVESVRRERTPAYDADCRLNQPTRPKSFRFGGSTHASRNQATKRAGCKNRDVGAGWNSTCCP